MLRKIERIYSRLLWLMMAVAAVYVGLMMVSIVYFTTFRALGWAYNQYSFTFIEYGFVYLLMLGSPWLIRNRGHVYIEMLTAAVSPAVRNILSRIVAALCVVICLVLAWYTGVLTVEDYVTDEYDQLRAQLDIKRWIITISMPIGFGLMGIEFMRFVFGKEPMHTGKAGVSADA